LLVCHAILLGLPSELELAPERMPRLGPQQAIENTLESKLQFQWMPRQIQSPDKIRRDSCGAASIARTLQEFTVRGVRVIAHHQFPGRPKQLRPEGQTASATDSSPKNKSYGIPPVERLKESKIIYHEISRIETLKYTAGEPEGTRVGWIYGSESRGTAEGTETHYKTSPRKTSKKEGCRREAVSKNDRRQAHEGAKGGRF